MPQRSIVTSFVAGILLFGQQEARAMVVVLGQIMAYLRKLLMLGESCAYKAKRENGDLSGIQVETKAHNIELEIIPKARVLSSTMEPTKPLLDT